MKISEMFYTVQGEGKRAGKPSFFIRTNFCNLRCRFKSGNLCDTAYTSWNPQDDKNIGSMEVEDIIVEYSKYLCKDVVITGGEPTMQSEELTELCSRIKEVKNDAVITIETNGTYTGDFWKYIDLVSVSPKLSTSTPYDTEYEKMHSKSRINIQTLGEINDLHMQGKFDVQWKFVISEEKDIDEILALQKEVNFSNEDVYLMPEGLTDDDLKRSRIDTVEICKRYKFNYTDRLHVIIWGDKRGV